MTATVSFRHSSQCVFTGFYLTDIKALLDSLQVMLEPVGHQKRFAIGGFDKIL